jgi:hypothetical protein
MKLNIPITASMEAAAVAAMPASEQAGIRCVPISPLVEAPQMKNVPASSQKSRFPDASAKARNAVAIGLPVARGAGLGSPVSP